MLSWTLGYTYLLTSSFFHIYIYPGVELLDHTVVPFLGFILRNLYTVFHSDCNSLYSCQQCTSFTFLHILTNICFCFLFHDNHSDKCEVIHICDFDSHLFLWWLARSSIFFICLFGQLFIFLLWKVSIQIFCPFFNWNFFILNYMSCLGEGSCTALSPLAWEIPWMEEPGRLKPMGLLRVG